MKTEKQIKARIERWINKEQELSKEGKFNDRGMYIFAISELHWVLEK